MKILKYWKPDGFEISSYKYSLKEKANQIHTTCGEDNTNLCTYTYNELGFRGDSIKKEGFKVMSLGCSITEGVGVNDNETWTSQFTNLVPNSVNLNFGVCGRSNDFIVRCLLSYYDLIKPDLVLIMYTYSTRKEIYTNDGGVEPYMATSAWGYMQETEDGRLIQKNLLEIQNDNEDFINWYKNHQLIKLFLESKNCNWLWNGSFSTPIEYEEFNRFDGNYKNFIDMGVAGGHAGPIQNSSYANELYNHIRTKLPEYISRVPENLLLSNSK